MRLLLDADGVRNRENKFVFAGKRSSRGNPHAQELAATIHFEHFTGATEELLLHSGAEPRGSRGSRTIRGETDGLRAQREYRGATRAVCAPLQGPASGIAIHDFPSQQVSLADEPGGICRRGMRIDLAR